MGRITVGERKLKAKLSALSELFKELLNEHRSDSFLGLKCFAKYEPDTDMDAGKEQIQALHREYMQRHNEIMKS